MLKFNLPGDECNLFCGGRLPKLVGVTLVNEEPSWSHPLHRHDDTCDMVLIINGEGRLFCKNRQFKTRKGDLTIYNKGVLHGEETSFEEPLEFIALHLADVALKGLDKDCIIPNSTLPIFKTGDLFYQMEMLFDLILRETSSAKPGYKNVCQNAVATILSLVARMAKEQAHDENEVANEDMDIATISEKLVAYLDENYNKCISLDDLSDVFHFNKFYISHVFKQETGYSPNQYIMNRRIGESQRLLLSTNMSVGEIAESVGYANINQFYSIFKKYKGVSPIKFRTDNSRTY